MSEEHSKLLDMIDCTYFRSEKIQLLADFERQVRLNVHANTLHDYFASQGEMDLAEYHRERIAALKD